MSVAEAGEIVFVAAEILGAGVEFEFVGTVLVGEDAPGDFVGVGHVWRDLRFGGVELFSKVII